MNKIILSFVSFWAVLSSVLVAQAQQGPSAEDRRYREAIERRQIERRAVERSRQQDAAQEAQRSRPIAPTSPNSAVVPNR